MFSSARTVNFIPRICMQKISGGQWRTFYHFASYKEAPTTDLQDIKRGNSLRNMTTQRAWHVPEGREQRASVEDRLQKRAHTNSTSYTRCLRQKEGKTPHDHTRHMACGRSMGKQSGDEKGTATLQADSTHRSCNGLLHFSNAEIFTQLFVDHWGSQLKTKRR